MLVDSHCHLADAGFSGDLDDVAARARAAGVSSALCILSADEPDEVARVGAVRRAWPEVQYSAGVHPHRAGSFASSPVSAAETTAQVVAEVGAVAVGEIGLDYHYDFAPRETQQAVFAAHLALAGRLGRPVIIHTREAAADTIALLRAAMPRVSGVMHCFTGTRDEARQALDLGLYISIAGIVTFPKADALRDVAAYVPGDRVLVETDAPFLAPVPHRGKRNEPAWVVRTVEVLAATRGVDAATLAADLAQNFRTFLGLEPVR